MPKLLRKLITILLLAILLPAAVQLAVSLKHASRQPPDRAAGRGGTGIPGRRASRRLRPGMAIFFRRDPGVCRGAIPGKDAAGGLQCRRVCAAKPLLQADLGSSVSRLPAKDRAAEVAILAARRCQSRSSGGRSQELSDSRFLADAVYHHARRDADDHGGRNMEDCGAVSFTLIATERTSGQFRLE